MLYQILADSNIAYMNVPETLTRKISNMPPQAQQEVLEAIEGIEEKYRSMSAEETNGTNEGKYPLDLIADLAMDVGVSDFAERHDFYAHGKRDDDQ